LMEFHCKKVKSLTCLLLILTSAFVGFSFLPRVKGEMAVPSLTPTSGKVGSTMQLAGNLTTPNGTFQVFWDLTLLLLNASAVGNSVNVSLTVPPATYGPHNITLSDVAAGENTTAVFDVSTAYSLSVSQKPAPAELQEGDNFTATLNMTGGMQGETDVANITVLAPNNSSYVSFGNLTTGNDGNGTLSVNYPADFPSGANTNFTGYYSVSFNGTVATASSFVGLTNSSEYHRDQAIDVKAVYAPDESVSLSIIGSNLNYSQSIVADGSGMVHYVNPTVLANASASSIYVVSVTSVSGPTQKVPPDVQSFTVPGFAVIVTARNLAGDPVPSLSVTTFENLTLVSSATSDANGSVTLNLEVGDYLCNASLGGQEVGRETLVVNETSTTFDLICNLTDLGIVVMDEDGVLIPDVEFQLVQTLHAAQVNENFTISVNATDVNGASVAQSLLPVFENASVDYALNASRYGMLFNTTGPLQLPVAAWFNVTIVCPKENLYLNVSDAVGRPIVNASVNAMEEAGGLSYSNNTGPDGTTTLRATFGRYLLRVYADGIELNETTVDLNVTTLSETINCSLYGLDVSVKISDYFGQSISNVNVTLQWHGYSNSSSIVSGSDGLATFKNITGGNLTVIARLNGQSNQLAVAPVYVTNSETIEIRLDKYLLLVGVLVDLGAFITVMIVVLAVILILCFEVYRRRRRRPEQSGS